LTPVGQRKRRETERFHWESRARRKGSSRQVIGERRSRPRSPPGEGRDEPGLSHGKKKEKEGTGCSAFLREKKGNRRPGEKEGQSAIASVRRTTQGRQPPLFRGGGKRVL